NFEGNVFEEIEVDEGEVLVENEKKNGFKIYEHHKLVEIDLPRKTEAEKATESRRLIVSELIERTQNAYWRMKDKGSPEENS
ncbi:29510_t:CDS:2, partial [Gigaspora margarita]